MNTEDKITQEKLKKYFQITEEALAKAEKAIIKGKEKQADEIITMVENYLKDARYFKEQGNYVNSFAALNYAHGWLDSGARLGIFNVKDNRLFTIK